MSKAQIMNNVSQVRAKKADDAVSVSEDFLDSGDGKAKYMVRNKTSNMGHYYRGKESFHLAPGEYLILDWLPTLYSGEIVLVKVKE